MNDELERLRDVAKAAAAYMRAEQVFFTIARAFTDDGRRVGGSLKDAHDALTARATDLRQTLARLAEVNPELVGD